MLDLRVASIATSLLLIALRTLLWLNLPKDFNMVQHKLPPWQKTALRKQQEIFDQIPKEWTLSRSVLDEARKQQQLTGGFIESLLDDATKDITSHTSQQLLDSMAHRSLTAVQVVEAFCRRSATAHQIVKHRTVPHAAGT